MIKASGKRTMNKWVNYHRGILIKSWMNFWYQSIFFIQVFYARTSRCWSSYCEMLINFYPTRNFSAFIFIYTEYYHRIWQSITETSKFIVERIQRSVNDKRSVKRVYRRHRRVHRWNSMGRTELLSPQRVLVFQDRAQKQARKVVRPFKSDIIGKIRLPNPGEIRQSQERDLSSCLPVFSAFLFSTCPNLEPTLSSREKGALKDAGYTIIFARRTRSGASRLRGKDDAAFLERASLLPIFLARSRSSRSGCQRPRCVVFANPLPRVRKAWFRNALIGAASLERRMVSVFALQRRESCEVAFVSDKHEKKFGRWRFSIRFHLRISVLV